MPDTTPGNLNGSERGCVVLDQPQHIEMPGDIRSMPTATRCEAAAAGLRHSRAPGQCADAPKDWWPSAKVLTGGWTVNMVYFQPTEFNLI